MSVQRRILFLFLGDPEFDRRVQNFANIFCAHGWDVTVVYGAEPKTLTVFDVSVHVIPIALTYHAGPRRFIQYHRLARVQALSLAEERGVFDVVVACDLYSFRAAATLKNLGKATRLVYDCREIYTELPSVAARTLVRNVWKTVEQRALQQADVVIVTAPHDADALLKVHQVLPRTSLVRNLPSYIPFAPDESVREEYRVAQDERLVVYLGGLQQGRGVIPTINAIADVLKTGKKVKALFIGDGSERHSLEALVDGLGLSSVIHFTGNMSAPQALRLLQSADIGVSLIEPLSRSYELALPSKIFEYMSAGLAVLSSDLIQVRELFADEPWITLVDPFNQDQVNEGLRKALVTSAEDRKRARELFENEYHFEAEIVRCEALLEQLVTP